MKKEIIVAITKCDLIPKEELKKLRLKIKHDVILISSLTNFNLEKLKNVIWKKLN